MKNNMKENILIFRTRLKELRTKNKLSQEALARETGLSRDTICNLETGRSRPNMEDIIILSEFFETTPNFLLGY